MNNQLSLRDAAQNLIDLENNGYIQDDWDEAMSDLRTTVEAPQACITTPEKRVGLEQTMRASKKLYDSLPNWLKSTSRLNRPAE